MHRILIGLLLAGLSVMAGFIGAAEPQAAKGEQVVKEGQLVCVGCHLEKQYGAIAQCTLHAKHAQGLLAEDGTLWTILDNSRGHFLITERKLQGKTLRVHGRAFPKTQVLEAHRYDLKEGEKWVAYDYCKVCGWEPGDHKGTDLCEDCASEK